MLLVQRMETNRIFLSSTSPSEWIPELTGNCAVCGDRVSSSRLGSPACLGCIVFFRRSIIQASKYKCLRDENCLINYEFRSSCRFCRLQKCLHVGMKESAVRRRDCLGPRRPSHVFAEPPILHSETDEQLIEKLIKIQGRQLRDHRSQSVDHTREATVVDMNKMFKWSFNNSIEWASQFDPFRKLTNESQKTVISEFGFAFMLIDQGSRTIAENEDGVWILQNGTFVHANRHIDSSEDEQLNEREKGKCQSRHLAFFNFLISSVKSPLDELEVDEFEIAVLKSLLFLTPSFPKEKIFSSHEERIEVMKNKCLSELMNHMMEKSADNYTQRFGELIMLIGNIRVAVKEMYNLTKVSDLFDSKKFDPFVRSFFLS